MTTTKTSLNIDEGRPSSKVLQPPGGGSSFTLGGGDPEPPQSRNPPAQRSAPVGEAAASPSTNTPTSNVPNRPLEDVATSPNFKKQDSHSRLFGESQPVDRPVRNKGASSFNPITGVAYPGFEDDAKQTVSPTRRPLSRADGNPIVGQQSAAAANQSQVMPTKVRQPPGGFSSGIF